MQGRELKPLPSGYEPSKLLALSLRQRLHVIGAELLFEMVRPLATLRRNHNASRQKAALVFCNCNYAFRNRWRAVPQVHAAAIQLEASVRIDRVHLAEHPEEEG